MMARLAIFTLGFISGIVLCLVSSYRLLDRMLGGE